MVEVVHDRQRAEYGPILQGLQPGHEVRPGRPSLAAPSLARGASGIRFQESEQRDWPHGSTLPFGSGLLRMGAAADPGARAEGRGGAGPVRDLLGGKTSQGAVPDY